MKHDFEPWTKDRTQLGGLGRVTIAGEEMHSRCRNCGVNAKKSRTGGVKFWVATKDPVTGFSKATWTTKRPACEKKAS